MPSSVIPNPYAGAEPTAMRPAHHPIAGLTADEVAPYEDSPVGNEEAQRAALKAAAEEAMKPDHVSSIQPTQTARQRLGLDP